MNLTRTIRAILLLTSLVVACHDSRADDVSQPPLVDQCFEYRETRHAGGKARVDIIRSAGDAERPDVGARDEDRPFERQAIEPRREVLRRDVFARGARSRPVPA